MTFGLDISDLSTNRADGTTRYTRELAQRLPALTAQDAWHYYSPAPVKDTWPSNVRLHVSPWPKYWTQARFPWDLLRFKPDVLLMPIQQLPIVRPRQMKTVAVIHDLAFHRYPQQTAHKDWILLHAFTAQVARQADAIIADSQATADDIAYYYGRTNNVHVVYMGVDHSFFQPATTEQLTQARAELQTAWPQLKQPFLLFVGQIQPRKNLGRLIEAFEHLHQTQPDLQLAIAGSHGWLQQPILDRIAQSNVRTHIHLLGRVTDEQLRSLYWQAQVFVLPSLYEGFGIPLLEAMASGCPVVAADVSSIPEVVGDAGVLINPESSLAIAAGIVTAQQSTSSRREKGLAQAAKFTWDTTAANTLKVLQTV